MVSSSTLVEHMTHNRKVKVSNPSKDTRKEKIAVKFIRYGRL